MLMGCILMPLLWRGGEGGLIIPLLWSNSIYTFLINPGMSFATVFLSWLIF